MTPQRALWRTSRRLAGDRTERPRLWQVLDDDHPLCGDRATVRRAAAECFKVFATHDGQLMEERYNLLNAWLAAQRAITRTTCEGSICSTRIMPISPFFMGSRLGIRKNTHLHAEYLAVLETSTTRPIS